MLAGSESVIDNELALAADGELGVETLPLFAGLDDQGPAVRRLGDGRAGLRGDGRYGRPPGLLFLDRKSVV